ncbi:2-dehydropantoate 2-reductase [uncultured Enterovirga sp.]|uniref:2-dehydropantoate 2-reductase n=1 Tax=uncultured Enterovirga sp. TaxID=2026352 RepID=UPI0035CA0BAE
MRLLVVGAGSTGGYFGARLAAAGRDVTFLVRPARAAQLAADRLRIVSAQGDLAIKPKTVTATDLGVPYDGVLLTVKAYSLAAAMDDVAPAVGPDTMILPVLNGMRHMDVLAARFGPDRVLGGVCNVATTIDDEGRILHLSPFHSLSYGELDGETSDRLRLLDETMRGASFDARMSSSIQEEMWEKWTRLAALGAATCLMRGAVGEIEAAPGGQAFLHALLDEIVAIIAQVGIPPSDGFLTSVRSQLTEPGSGLTSSMYRDLRDGSPVEVEQILGDLLGRASALGMPTPLLSAAHTHLSIHQSHRLATT